MPWNKKNIQPIKTKQKDSSSTSSYTKKTATKKVPPSSRSSSTNSTIGLISKLPKQANTKKLHKLL